MFRLDAKPRNESQTAQDERINVTLIFCPTTFLPPTHRHRYTLCGVVESISRCCESVGDNKTQNNRQVTGENGGEGAGESGGKGAGDKVANTVRTVPTVATVVTTMKW
jgi:hypothetical protein